MTQVGAPVVTSAAAVHLRTGTTPERKAPGQRRGRSDGGSHPRTRREVARAAVGAAVLAACGRQTGGEGAGARQAVPASIRVAAWGLADKQAYDVAAAAFMKANPAIRVEVELPQGSGDHYAKIMTLMAGGAEQDVMYMATHAGYMQVFSLGGFKDLTATIKQDRSFDSKAALYPQADQMTRIKGQTVGIPVDSGGYVMFFNLTSLQRANLPLPKDGWTWADFERYAKLTTAGEGQSKVWGYRSQTGRMDSWIWQNGGDWYDRNINPTKSLLGEAEAIEAFQVQADMTFRQQSAPSPAELAAGAATIQNGRIALYLEGPWNIPAMKESQLRWDVAPLPKNKKQVTMLQVEILTLSSRTKAPEASWAFVKHMFSDEGQRPVIEVSGRMPATQDQTRRLFVPWAKEQGVTTPDALVDLFKYGRMRPLPVRADDINKVLNPAMAEILNEGKPAKSVLSAIVPQINDILKNSPAI